MPSLSSESMEPVVGFSNLPNQYHRKSVKKGFEFTLMVVGEFYKFWITFNLFLCKFCFFRRIWPWKEHFD